MIIGNRGVYALIGATQSVMLYVVSLQIISGVCATVYECLRECEESSTSSSLPLLVSSKRLLGNSIIVVPRKNVFSVDNSNCLTV